MLWIRPRIDKIEHLLGTGTAEGLTYAALEARLAIEHVCYERLRNAHKYIAHEDLRRWQPAKIATQLMDEVDPLVSSNYTLSMSKYPSESSSDCGDIADRDQSDYVEIGHQSGFNPKKLEKLWYSLGGCLHIKIPSSSEDTIEQYGDREKNYQIVSDALSLLKSVSQGNMVGALVPNTVSFVCQCGSKNTRSADRLHNGQIISCINANCVRKFKVSVDEDELIFQALIVTLKCCNCQAKFEIERSKIPDPRKFGTIKFACPQCKEENELGWKLVHFRRGS